MLSVGTASRVHAAPDDAVDPSVALMEDAADALGDGDDTTYDELVDTAVSGAVWVPTTALDALLDRDVEEIGHWIFVLDADDEILLHGADAVIEWERDALAATTPGTSSNPEQTDEINDADAEGVGILEIIDVRAISIPDSVRTVLAPLPVDGAPLPTSDAYRTALADLDATLAGDEPAAAIPATTAPSAPPTTVATPDTTAAPTTVAVAPSTPAVVTAPSGDSSPFPMIAVGAIAALALAVGSFAMLRGRKSEQLADIAFTDGLTGLKNRRRLDADVAAQRERGERATATLMIDVDHFKAFNDTHGHAMGDDVLRLVGDALQREFRRTDVPYRYGGEEFCVLLNDVTPGEAVSAGERARAAISAIVLSIDERITVSIGVSIGPAEHLGDTIKRADGALYDAKAAGRDRVTFATS